MRLVRPRLFKWMQQTALSLVSLAYRGSLVGSYPSWFSRQFIHTFLFLHLLHSGLTLRLGQELSAGRLNPNTRHVEHWFGSFDIREAGGSATVGSAVSLGPALEELASDLTTTGLEASVVLSCPWGLLSAFFGE